jgi:predicted amidophosphoribosyltransferase
MIDRLPPLNSVYLIIPVPLHIQRLRERELNPPLLLADRRSPRHPCLLYQSDPDRVVTGAGHALSERPTEESSRCVYSTPPASITSKHIRLIDDVFTTDTIVNKCAKILRKVGSGNVFVVTWGRTVDASAVPDRILAQQTHHTLGLRGG